jgi:hypothetical protein
MADGVKVQISETSSGEIEFNVLQCSALGGAKPLWRFRISREEARPLHEQLGEILDR